MREILIYGVTCVLKFFRKKPQAEVVSPSTIAYMQLERYG